MAESMKDTGRQALKRVQAEASQIVKRAVGSDAGKRAQRAAYTLKEKAVQMDPRGRSTGSVGSRRSLPGLAKRTFADFTGLAKLEAQLFQERVKTQAAKAGRSAIVGAAGGVLLLFALLFLLATAAAALAIILPWWLSLLIVAVVCLLVGGLMVLGAVRGLKRTTLVPSEAKEEIKEDVRWVRTQRS